MNLELKKRICLDLECSTVCSRDMDIDTDRQKKKFGYGEEWKRSVVLIKLLLRRFSRELTKTGKY